MKKKSILHLITSAKNASPFDVNMAYDAGYEHIMPYTNVCLDEVQNLTQDAIFSRSSSGIKQEALFFGGRDIHLALEMQETARKAMFGPFETSTFADPSGAFTTAGAMLAQVERYLKTQHTSLTQQTVAIFGASGTVGTTAALIASSLDAQVLMVAHTDLDKMQNYVTRLNQLYHTHLRAVEGDSDNAKIAVLNSATVALCTAPAGLRVLALKHFSASESLRVMADVNAVPPSGVEAIENHTNAEFVADTTIVGFGALAIGQLKYKTQHSLLEQMRVSEKAIHLDYQQAYVAACQHLAS